MTDQVPAPLNVILNDRPLRQTLTGVGNYIAQLLTHQPQYAPDLRITPFFFGCLPLTGDWRARHASFPSPPARNPTNPASQPTNSSKTRQRDVGGSRKPWWLRRMMQGAYTKLFQLAARGYAVYHEPNHIPMPCNLPTVTTIHDLSVVKHPDWHPADRVKWYEAEFQRGVRQTQVFLAASEFTKREIVETCGVDPKRIHVTYQAPRDAFHPRPAEQTAAVTTDLELPERYFLYVGTLEPRKNLPGLLSAFAELPYDLRRRCPLLIAGAWGWKRASLKQMLAEQHVEGDVRLLGFLSDEELAVCYSRCTAFVWPTFYEGFGLPPLEAMACGAPVLTSDVASLPEVIGDAHPLLDPTDPAAWTEAMRAAAEAGESQRVAARQRSIARAAQFTWQRFVSEHVAAYAACVECGV